VRDKQSIRYLGFECTEDGGRRLDFAVIPSDGSAIEVHIDVEGPHFTGADRIMIQEAAGIGYLKMQELCEQGGVRNALLVRMTAIDIGRYRQVVPASRRQRKGSFSGAAKAEAAGKQHHG